MSSIFETQWRMTAFKCPCGDFIWHKSAPDPTKEYGLLLQRYEAYTCRTCHKTFDDPRKAGASEGEGKR